MGAVDTRETEVARNRFFEPEAKASKYMCIVVDNSICTFEPEAKAEEPPGRRAEVFMKGESTAGTNGNMWESKEV